MNDTLHAIVTANRDILIQKMDPKKPVQAEGMKMQDQNLQQSEDVNSTKHLKAIELNINQSSENTDDLNSNIIIYTDTREIDMKNSETANNLVSFLTNRGLITVEMKERLNRTSTKDGNKELWDLVEHGSTQMYETVFEYLERTGQSDVVQFLQPNYGMMHSQNNTSIKYVWLCMHCFIIIIFIFKMFISSMLS